jgi:hypothetical protein
VRYFTIHSVKDYIPESGFPSTKSYVASTATKNMQDVKTAQPAPWVPGAPPWGTGADLRGAESRTAPHHVTPGGVVIRLVQANCRRSPDCTTTFLTKATKKAEVVLLQEFWADKKDTHGVWKTTQDSNYWLLF